MAPSPMQILVIALIILLLFGASRLGDVGKGLGQGIRNFKKGISGDDEEGGEGSKESKQLKDKDGDETKSSAEESKRSEKS
jgi:sec-independent protein translocase protein TatA